MQKGLSFEAALILKVNKIALQALQNNYWRNCDTLRNLVKA